jgi:hypothetical protein
MGGKALNKYGVFTERKNTVEFNQIGYELNVRVFFDLGLFVSVVTCYRTKADHGDLDLLIKVPLGTNINWVDYIRKAFTPQAVNSNGGVYSFDYQNFQIDFIPIKEENWNIAQVYGFFDPLGNCMGKTYHKFGLSYGWEGLFYKYRNFHGTNSANILLSNDAEKIFEFGGYDYDRYLKGFDTLEEIFKFCIDSRYFDAEMFQMENLKSLDKKRNRKRGSYHLFLNYIKDNGITTKYSFADKERYIYTIATYFPEANLIGKLEELKQKDLKDFYLAEKFNGKLVMEWLPELKGKELGQAIKNFRDYLGDAYETIVSAASQDELRQIFMDVYNGKAL